MRTGWEKGKTQITLDADPSRGLTLGTFIHKFAPKSENDTGKYLANLIREFSPKVKGLDANTSFGEVVAAVGVDKVAQTLAKYENKNTYNKLLSEGLIKEESETKKEILKNKPTTQLVKNIRKSNTDRTVATPVNITESTKPETQTSLGVSGNIQMAWNGIVKNAVQEPLAKIESWYDEITGPKMKELTNEDRIKLAKINQEKIKVASQLKKNKDIKAKIDSDVQNFIDTTPEMIAEDSYNLNKLSFGSRNRGNNKPASTRGVVLQLHNEISDVLPKFSESRQVIARNKSTGKMFFPNSESEVKNKSDYEYTVQNKYKVTDFEVFKKTPDKANGTGTWFPQLIDKNGKPITYHVGAKMNDNSLYQGLYGGKLLIISEDGKSKMLYVGSVDKLKKDFYNFKDKTHSNEVTVIQLDEGSHNKIKTPQNQVMSDSDWKSYDALNNLGGHAFYVK